MYKHCCKQNIRYCKHCYLINNQWKCFVSKTNFHLLLRLCFKIITSFLWQFRAVYHWNMVTSSIYGQVLNSLTTAEYNFLLNTQSSKNLPYLRLGCSQLARWSQLQPIFLYYRCRYKNVYAEKLCHAACAYHIWLCWKHIAPMLCRRLISCVLCSSFPLLVKHNFLAYFCWMRVFVTWWIWQLD
jgi:hypothetical protein